MAFVSIFYSINLQNNDVNYSRHSVFLLAPA